MQLHTLLVAIAVVLGFGACRETPGTDRHDVPILVPDDDEWTDRGVVVNPGAPGEWDARLYGMMNPGAVARRNGRFYLYYMGSDGDRYDQGPANRALGVATSEDGVRFTKYHGNPVLRHQPDGGHGNRVEEGIFSAAAVVEPDGTVLLYYGGMESIAPREVDGDAVLARSDDGLSFHVHGNVLSHADSDVYNAGDEIFPAAAWIDDGGFYHLYYVAKGRVGLWTLGIASGPTPHDLTDTRQALDLEHPIHGAGVPVRVPGLGIILPIHVAAEPDRIDILLVDPQAPADLRDRLGSIQLDGIGSGPDVDFATMSLLLDRERQRWLLYHVDSRTGAIRLRTAPLRYRERG